MRKLLLVLIFALFPNLAWAQCNGIFPANTYCGNNTGSSKVPAAVALGTIIGVNTVANSNLAQMPAYTAKCNPTASAANVQDCATGPVVTPEDFGAKHDGSTDDTTAIQNAINAVITAGGGTVQFLPGVNCYKTVAQLTINVSAVATRFAKVVWLIGAGPAQTCITNLTIATTALSYTGNTSQPESYLRISGIRFTGNGVASSQGIGVSVGAFITIDHVIIEGWSLGYGMQDVDQLGMYDTEIRFNTNGAIILGIGSVTDPNSLTFHNVTIGNNTTSGITINNFNVLNFYGGSIQFNGSVGGGATQFGLSLAEGGHGGGGGTAVFQGVDFENNGGAGDVVSTQSSNIADISFISDQFLRVTVFGTNNIQINGSTASVYHLSGNSFRGSGAYVPSAARPNIAVNNTNALVIRDGSNIFSSPTVEAPQTTVSACGTTPAIAGNEVSGVVQFGTGTPTACTVTFGIPYPASFPPSCAVTWRGNLATMTYGTSATTLTLGQTATSSDVVDYHCAPKNGG